MNCKVVTTQIRQFHGLKDQFETLLHEEKFMAGFDLCRQIETVLVDFARDIFWIGLRKKQSGTFMKEQTLPHGTRNRPVAFSPDGKYTMYAKDFQTVVIIATDELARIHPFGRSIKLSLDQEKSLTPLRGYDEASIHGYTFAGEDKILVSVRYGGNIEKLELYGWHEDEIKPLQDYNCEDQPLTDFLTLERNGILEIIGIHNEEGLVCFENGEIMPFAGYSKYERGLPGKSINLLPKYQLKYIRPTADNRQVLSVSIDRSLGLWDVERRCYLGSIARNVRNFAPNPQNPNEVVYVTDKKIFLLNIKDRVKKELYRDTEMTAVNFSPGSRYILAGYENGMVKIISCEDGQLFKTIETGLDDLSDIILTPKNSLLALAWGDFAYFGKNW